MCTGTGDGVGCGWKWTNHHHHDHYHHHDHHNHRYYHHHHLCHHHSLISWTGTGEGASCECKLGKISSLGISLILFYFTVLILFAFIGYFVLIFLHPIQFCSLFGEIYHAMCRILLWAALHGVQRNQRSNIDQNWNPTLNKSLHEFSEEEDNPCGQPGVEILFMNFSWLFIFAEPSNP